MLDICPLPDHLLMAGFIYGAWWTCPNCGQVWRTWSGIRGTRYALPATEDDLAERSRGGWKTQLELDALRVQA